MTGSRTKQLLIFIGQRDTWQERPLYEAIVDKLAKHDVSGVSVLSGTMGYGSHRRVHRKGLFGVSDDKPVAIIAIDEEVRLRTAIETIRPMIREGLITLSDIEIVLQAPADAEHE